jgi:putative transposase
MLLMCAAHEDIRRAPEAIFMPSKRIKDLSGPAHVFITTTCINWLPVFSIGKAAELVANQLNETAIAKKIPIAAYVIMPTHFHALIGFPDIKDMPEFIRSFKSLSSRAIKSFNLVVLGEPLNRSREFHLWQRRYDELIIYSEEQFKIKLNYIHNNPVKAGLVKFAVDWKYSSARDWILGENGLVQIDKCLKWLK